MLALSPLRTLLWGRGLLTLCSTQSHCHRAPAQDEAALTPSGLWPRTAAGQAPQQAGKGSPARLTCAQGRGAAAARGALGGRGRSRGPGAAQGEAGGGSEPGGVLLAAPAPAGAVAEAPGTAQCVVRGRGGQPAAGGRDGGEPGRGRGAPLCSLRPLSQPSTASGRALGLSGDGEQLGTRMSPGLSLRAAAPVPCAVSGFPLPHPGPKTRNC